MTQNTSHDTTGRWLSRNWRGPAGARSYNVYLPAGHQPNQPAPLLVLLHGCTQTAEGFAEATRFTELADRHGFLIAAPKQTRANQQARCWRWFDPAHQGRDRGEPAILAGITRAVTDETDQWTIDASRVYVTGISAGGAMALIVAANYPDLFAAVGAHSGLPYRSARSVPEGLIAARGHGFTAPAPQVPPPPLIVFQGGRDRVVAPSVGNRVVRQWLGQSAVAENPRNTTYLSHAGFHTSVTHWAGNRGPRHIEHWQIDELGHAWSGGLVGGSFSDPRGPSASEAMWDFFAAHTLPDSEIPVPFATITNRLLTLPFAFVDKMIARGEEFALKAIDTWAGGIKVGEDFTAENDQRHAAEEKADLAIRAVTVLIEQVTDLNDRVNTINELMDTDEDTAA